MKNTQIKMTYDQQENNLAKLSQYIHDNKLTIPKFAKQVGVSRPVCDKLLKSQTKGSLETWRMIEEYTELKFEYEVKEEKKQVLKQEKDTSKSDTFIPEHVIPMLQLHGNTVIRDSLIRKHKKEGVLEELRELGFGNIKIKLTDNDSWVLEKS